MVLNCIPANFDHPQGEPGSVITVVQPRRGDVISWVVSMADSRLLVAKLLVSLATYDDPFAQHLLDDHFGFDDEGNFMWPRGESEV